MSDTSSDSEDTIQNPAKRSRISTLESKNKLAVTVMNFAGHTPTKNTAAQRNLFTATVSDIQDNPSGAHLKAETIHSLEFLNPIHPPITPSPLISTPPSTSNIEHTSSMDTQKILEAIALSREDNARNVQTVQTGLQTLQTSQDNVLETVIDVNKKIDKVGDDVLGLQTKFEDACVRIDTLEKKVGVLESKLLSLEQQHARTSSQFRGMKDAQLRSMEHTFDNFLILRGLPLNDNETCEELKAKINNMIEKKAGITAPCNSATRVGKPANGTRPTRVYWMNKDHRNTVLRNGTKLLPIKISKDLPFPVRQVQAKIKTKGWELKQKDTATVVEYRDLGLVINGEFVHHEDIVLDKEVTAQKQSDMEVA